MSSRFAGLAEKTRALAATVGAKAKDDKDMKDTALDDDNTAAKDEPVAEAAAAPSDPEDQNDGGADDDSEDKDGKPMKKDAVSVERARWATVLRSEHAAGRTDAAVELLAETDLPAAKVVAMIGKFPVAAAKGNAFLARMGEVANPAVLPNGGADPVEETAKERMARRHGVKLT